MSFAATDAVIATLRIKDGVEWFDTPFGQECQCARCGSSCSTEIEDTIDLGTLIWRTCLSSTEWCRANPLPGRERERGAHWLDLAMEPTDAR